MDFSEAFEACDLKVGRYRQLIDFMKYMSIEGQGHFLTLAQGRVHTKIKPIFLRNHYAILNKILYESFQVQGYVKKLLT